MERSIKMIENYVCPNCWKQIQSCTCEFYPPWTLIMIDKNIQDVVRILNQKGYTTIACCESHYDNNTNLYVAFNMRYNNISLPEGFVYAKGKTIISYSFKKEERKTRECFENIKAEKLKILLEWAQLLPENPMKFKR